MLTKAFGLLDDDPIFHCDAIIASIEATTCLRSQQMQESQKKNEDTTRKHAERKGEGKYMRKDHPE